MEEWLQREFLNYPTLYSWQRAIWLGEVQHLPFWWRETYREQGMLAVLALSGQHVWALSVAVIFGLRCFFLFLPPRGSWLYGLRLLTPVVAAWALWMTSESITALRAGIAISLGTFLKLLPQRIAPWRQIIGVSFLWFLFSEESFSLSLILSSVGAGLLSLLPQVGFFRYFFLCLFLPVWMAPTLAGWFAKWSVGASWYQFQKSWVWDLILLPGCFFITFLRGILPDTWFGPVGQSAERILKTWMQWEVGRENPSYFSVVSPSLGEQVLMTFWLVALSAWVISRCGNAARSFNRAAAFIDFLRRNG